MLSQQSKKSLGTARRVAELGSRLRSDRRGTAAVMTALGATVLMGVAGLGVDVAYWELTGRKLQGVADEAALAASIAYSSGASSTEVASVAKSVAASYGYVSGQNGVSVTTTSPYPSGCSSKCEVKVAVSQVQPQYFTRLFLASGPSVASSAVAKPPGAPTGGTMCVMSLDPTDSSSVGFSGSTNLCLGGSVDPNTGACSQATCDLYNDSNNSTSTTFSGTESLTARNIFLSGGYSLGNNATISPTPATYLIPSPDPYSDLSISINASTITVSDPDFSISKSYTGCPSGTAIKVNAGNTQTIDPGCYSSIDVEGGGKLVMNAGTYIIDGGNLSINSGNGNYGSLTGAGVTIILTSSKCSGTTGSSCTKNAIGTVSFGSQVTVALTAPTADAEHGIPGIAIWVDNRALAASNSLNGGSTQIINGVMYMPTQNVTYAGGSGSVVNNMTATACSQLVAYTVNFSGSSYFSHSDCKLLNIPVKDPVAPPLLTE